MGRKLRKAEGEMEMAEKRDFIFCRTQNIAALLQNLEKQARSSEQERSQWSGVPLTQAGEARDRPRWVHDGEICVLYSHYPGLNLV